MPSDLQGFPQFTGVALPAPRSGGPGGGRLVVAAVAALALAACGPAGSRGGPQWIDRTAEAMDSKLRILLEGADRASALRASEAVLATVGAADAFLSPAREDSKVGWLNARPVGEAVPLDADLCRVLAEVGEYSALAPGAFEPVIGSLVDAWDLDGDGRVPSVVELEAARRAAGPGGMTFDLGRCTSRRLAATASLEPWGFVKGYSLRAVRDTLLARGVHSARVNFGDQVMVMGPSETGGPWRIPIASPEDDEPEVFTLWLAGGSASTSSQSNRYVQSAGQTVGHILDPRTGTPVPGWGSLTVVAYDPLRADVLSTALFVLGPDSALAWASRHNDVGVLILDRRDGAVRFRWNDGLRPALDSATATPIR